jgi:hypothetical protein
MFSEMSVTVVNLERMVRRYNLEREGPTLKHPVSSEFSLYAATIKAICPHYGRYTPARTE